MPKIKQFSFKKSIKNLMSEFDFYSEGDEIDIDRK